MAHTAYLKERIRSKLLTDHTSSIRAASDIDWLTGLYYAVVSDIVYGGEGLQLCAFWVAEYHERFPSETHMTAEELCRRATNLFAQEITDFRAFEYALAEGTPQLQATLPLRQVVEQPIREEAVSSKRSGFKLRNILS